jgi:prepilin-type N-terminal cleavage/methylation domain-containing protein
MFGFQTRRTLGFTIVELLIVIVVIGILAAITIVAYTGVQQRANASSAQSGASQAGRKALAFAVDNSDNYPTTLAAAGVNDTSSTTFQYSVNNAASPKTFCVTATTSTSSYWVSAQAPSRPVVAVQDMGLAVSRP